MSYIQIVQMEDAYEKVIEPKPEETVFPQSTVYQYGEW